MKHLAILTLHFSLLTLHSSAAVPMRWTVETTRAQPATFEAYQGETLAFEAALQSAGKPLELSGIAALYWQTNGMGSAYWETTAAVNSNRLSAVWTPEMDVGARVYNCFIGVPGTIYHAAFQLRLRPSPGAEPNTLPLPVPVIDFAKVRVLNPPWGSGGGGVDTNAVREIVDGSFAGGTNAVNAAMSDISNKLDSELTVPGEPYKASLKWKETGDGYELVIDGVPFHVYGSLFKVDSLDDIVVGGIPLSSTLSWYLPVTYDRELYPYPMIYWDNMVLNINAGVSIGQSLSVAAPVYATAYESGSWDSYGANGETLPTYLASGNWNTASDPFVKTSEISASNPSFSNEVATVARTVTPPPSPTLRLFDEVRQCYWIGRMVNGVINWEVE